MADCKLGEKGCWKDGKCHYTHDCENKVLTNADRIRAMSDEELAKRFSGNDLCGHIQDNTKFCESRGSCTDCIIEWLKQPAE